MIAIVYSMFFLAMKNYFIIFSISYFVIKVVTKFQNFGTFLIKNYSFAKVVIANLR